MMKLSLNELTVGAIYGGIGSTMIGPVKVGFKPKFIIDPRKDYLNEETTNHNWGHKFPRSNELRAFPKIKVHLIVAQPRCADFSLLNRQMTREGLFLIDPEGVQYVKALKEIKKRNPDFFILENLPRIRQFLFFPQGDNQFYATTKIRGNAVIEVLPWISFENYKVHQYDINASQYGLPQFRRRLFIIGHLHKYTDFFDYEPPNETPMTVKEAFLGLGRPHNIEQGGEPETPNHTTSPLTERQFRLVCGTKPGEKNANKERRILWDEPAPTVVGASLRQIHPRFNRYTSTREAARLMGYPDDFVFFGSINQTMGQVGRAVCPPITEHIAQHIKDTIEQYNQAPKLKKIFESL